MLNINTLKILNVKFNVLTLSELISIVHDKLVSNQKFLIALSNPEFLLESKKNPLLFNYLNAVEINLADGIGIVWASKLLYKNPLNVRLTGTDFFPELVKLCSSSNFSFFILGGKPNICNKVISKFEKEFNYFGFKGCHHGFFDLEDEKKIIANINSLNPDVLMVCLGNPKQEEWIFRNFDKINAKLIFGNGGVLDFWSNNVKRAPLWIQNLGFEWLYRLFQDFTFYRIKRQSKLLIFPFLVFIQFYKQGFKRI
ncbi:WecB/TagA/CpsF family glycosyltransferase [Algoriphagus sp. CAU 1675]|uniref:WecB/TagA/CpsF family glycosyltransferase n=1 Tax=Algoriphagus sp. CAU 1675 TaxID=3032597 RepID=UPI0023D9A5EA|nr:WecB/TagA/CpsF family glycosyltransferase [Algoriphagus sp. CAU 1675]MDF2158187.1 WecB/TagA/CpsF family glycosyltransferase [Algoriphagus sp. CAU 1675]